MKACCFRLLFASVVALCLWRLVGGFAVVSGPESSLQSARPFALASSDGRPLPASDAEGLMPQPPPSSAESLPPRRGRRGGSRASEYAKNHESVKAAFGEAVSQASAATVRILAGGEAAALGAVVDAEGYVVSKASLLSGELACRFDDGREVAAEIVGVNEEHDLALVKVDCGNLTPTRWRTGDAPAGTLVAAVAPQDALLALGVVGAEPRPIQGSPRAEQRRGWLGIALGGGEAGLTITGVYPGTAAREAGVRIGDRIRSINGAAMKSAEQVVQTVGRHFAGQKITLLVVREGRDLELSATLGDPGGHEPQDHWGGGPFSRRRDGFPVAIPHDAAVEPADCGGPLVDCDGSVVGINIARALRVTTYAIPAAVVQEVLDELRQAQGGIPGAE